MAAKGFRLDRGGVSKVLKEQSAALVNSTAAKVADGVRADIGDEEDHTVEVQEYTTDRGAASVTIVGPRGMEFQATRGSLTKAAAALGLEVKEK